LSGTRVVSTNWTRVTDQSSIPYLMMPYYCMALPMINFCWVGGWKFKDSGGASRHPILDSPINSATNKHTIRCTVCTARERNPRGGGRARGGNRGRNVGRGLSRGTSLSPTCSPAGRDTRLLGCGSSGAGLWWTCEGLDCNVSKEAI
jgi:hypothetical protein